MQRFAFYVDSEGNKACNLHVAQRPLTKGVLFAPGDMDVTGDVRFQQQAIGDQPS